MTGEHAQPADQLGRELAHLLGVRRQGVLAPAQLYDLKKREHRRRRSDHHPLTGGVLEQRGSRCTAAAKAASEAMNMTTISGARSKRFQ